MLCIGRVLVSLMNLRRLLNVCYQNRCLGLIEDAGRSIGSIVVLLGRVRRSNGVPSNLQLCPPLVI